MFHSSVTVVVIENEPPSRVAPPRKSTWDFRFHHAQLSGGSAIHPAWRSVKVVAA